MKVKSCSRIRATPWTVAHQAPLSMEFSRQEYWSGLPFPSPEDLPDPGIEPGSPILQADALTSQPPGKTSLRKKNIYILICIFIHISIYLYKQLNYLAIHLKLRQVCKSTTLFKEKRLSSARPNRTGSLKSKKKSIF